MERRFQVFVSSTFDDLEQARKEVSTAILRSSCFPAGMELFPAADLEQLEYIKQIIAESDYFILVSAGKYGSIHPNTGLSFTEMEYDFAVEIGKPIIRLLHKSPFQSLPGKAIEQSDQGRKKLEAFRAKLSTARLVNYWNDSKELGQQAVLALLDIIKRSPARGWVRGDQALTIEIIRELEQLRSIAAKITTTAPKKEELLQFNDLVKLTQIPILAASSEEGSRSNSRRVGMADMANKDVAEAVFLALISHTAIENIGEAASDILTDSHEFPKKYSKHNYIWLEMEDETTKHFLYYLESRGLARAASPSYWQLTSRGRANAVFLSTQKNIG